MDKYQEALNALCDEDEMYKIAKGFSFDDDYTSEYAYEKAKEYCKSTMQGLIDNYAWIPVEERLPELNTKVLVTWRTYHSGNHYIDILYRDEYGRWGCGVELTSGCVVAWMPLPEAYGGKR